MPFTPILWTYRKNRRGVYPIKIRITTGDQPARYVTLPYKVRPEDWDEVAERVRLDHPNAGHINLAITEKLAELERIQVLRKGTAGAGAIVDTAKSGGDFYYWFQKDIAAERARGGAARADVNQQSLNVMKLWRKRWDVDDLTKESLDSLVQFLRDKGNEHNTIVDKVSRIRTVVKRYLKKQIEENPFEGFSFSLRETRPKGLNDDDIQRICNLRFGDREVGLLHARNTYLLSLLLHGMRRGDLFRLKWSENITPTHVEYSMNKTGRAMRVKITAAAWWILFYYYINRKGEYVLPFLEGVPEEKIYDRIKLVGKNINRALGVMGKRANTSHRPTLHNARHAFTKKAKRAGVDVQTQQRLLGHSKITTTIIYSRALDSSESDEATDLIFGT